MKIVLLSPKGPLYRVKGGVFRKSLRYQPLTLTTLAALVPKELDAEVILYDEGSYPSGSACGAVVAENPDYASRAMGLWRRTVTGPDGAPVAQPVAFARDGLSEGARTIPFEIAGTEVLALRGKTALEEIDKCGGADVLISNQSVEPDRGCLVFDAVSLIQSGAVAGFERADGLHFVTVRDHTGERLWNGGAVPWW